jgi:hypothetical protein
MNLSREEEVLREQKKYESFLNDYAEIKTFFCKVMTRVNLVDFHPVDNNSSYDKYDRNPSYEKRMMSLMEIFCIVRSKDPDESIASKNALVVKLKSIRSIYLLYPDEKNPIKDGDKYLLDFPSTYCKMFSLYELYHMWKDVYDYGTKFHRLDNLRDYSDDEDDYYRSNRPFSKYEMFTDLLAGNESDNFELIHNYLE